MFRVLLIQVAKGVNMSTFGSSLLVITGATVIIMTILLYPAKKKVEFIPNERKALVGIGIGAILLLTGLFNIAI